MKEPVAFVYREGAGIWWAELWVETKPGSAWSDNPLLARQNPPRPEGMDREGLTLHSTRWGARRSAERMKQRYLSGHPVDVAEEIKRHEVVA